MKLSVIVPVYNCEKFLVDCLESLVSQTLKDIEVIAVNDGSTDGSEAILNAYVERYPAVFKAITVENGGQGRARNIGIEQAKGDYIGFVDSDDWIERDMYEKLYNAVTAENADIAICDMLLSYSDGHTVYDKQHLEYGCIASAGSSCNKIFRAGFIGNTRFPVGVWYEDFDFSARLLASSNKTVSVFEPLYVYRCGHDSTMNNNNSAKNLDIVKVFEGLDDYFARLGKEAGFEHLVLNSVLIDAINRVNLQNSSDKKKIIRGLRDYAHRRIPSLSACEAYKSERYNRRIIIFLNYHGLTDASKLLLCAKHSIGK